MRKARFQLLLVEAIPGERSMPRVRRSRAKLALDLPDAFLHFLRGGLRRLDALGLLAQQFLIDEAVEGTAAILVGDLSERTAVCQSLEANGIVPVALQDDVTIHGGDNAVDYVSSEHARDGSRQKKQQYEMGELSHQNACPILKKKLK